MSTVIEVISPIVLRHIDNIRVMPIVGPGARVWIKPCCRKAAILLGGDLLRYRHPKSLTLTEATRRYIGRGANHIARDNQFYAPVLLTT